MSCDRLRAILAGIGGRPFIRHFAASLLVLLSCGLLWAASGTVHGRFWLTSPGLQALAQVAAAVPAIGSLSLGQDGRLETGQPFDTYRFINGTLVTHYAGQARPGAEQPIIFVEDELRRLGVSRGQYDALTSLMASNRIGFITQDRADNQTDLHFAGRYNEWDVFLIYVPGDGDPGNRPLAEWGRLAPHWFWATRS